MTWQATALLALVTALSVLAHVIGKRKIDAARLRVQQTSDLHLATIEALARAIDAKDQTAERHIQRVGASAVGLAHRLGLPSADIDAIKTAALLHDIGKLAIPEHILSKPGPLTPEEIQKVRRHPEVGADILADVPFPYPVLPLIRSHHERWDGEGYPAGLKGDAIPIGARIFSIVDYFDTVTADGPHHTALGYESAVAQLKYEAGRALDPRLVDTFIEILPAFAAQFAGPRPARISQPATTASLAKQPPIAQSRSVFDDIALAHREIYALYEIAQALGTSLGVADTMALISSKVANIVPWSSCALFLSSETDQALTCRYAAGADAARLLNLTIENGVGLCGWVARHRRTLIWNRGGEPAVHIDAPPGTTFESAIVCPLMANDQFIGTLDLYHHERGRYRDDHRRLLEQVAEQAAAVIHNSIVFEQTQVDSLTDPLTGLPNRRSMFAHLTRELARAQRLHSEMAVIVMDIDDFKAINDTHGHQVGDRVLREVAVALQGSLRPYDLCVRYAGDEFFVVLADCSRESADAKRRELQQRLSEISIDVPPGTILRLGASAGASVFPHDGATYESLLADADQRMYRDKAGRRDRAQD